MLPCKISFSHCSCSLKNKGSKPKIWNHATSPARQGRASLCDSECKISNGDCARGKEWAGAVNVGSENRPYVVKGVRVHGQSMNECNPPSPHFRLVFFFLLSVLMCSPISLSFCTMEYHCGAEILSLTSAGLHNENKWAGSKYAGCLPLYTSQPIGFHQKLRWIVSPKAHDNASQCFIYLKWNSKAVSKDLTCTFSPIWNISFKCFYSCGWYFFKVIKMVMIQYVKKNAFAVQFTITQINI